MKGVGLGNTLFLRQKHPSCRVIQHLAMTLGKWLYMYSKQKSSEMDKVVSSLLSPKSISHYKE